MLHRVSSECFFLKINIQILIPNFYMQKNALIRYIFLLLCPSIFILSHILHVVSNGYTLTYFYTGPQI